MSRGLVKYEEVESKIIELRGQKVILDSNVAQLYSVKTKEINQVVKNNPHKFPIGYILELDIKEWEQMKSKFLTSMKPRNQTSALTRCGD